MLAAQLIGTRDIRLTEVDEPAPAAGQLLLSVAACGICGSDLHCYQGSAYKGREVTEPGRVMGHEFSGTVLAAPGVAGVSVGDRVAVRPQVNCGVCPQCLKGSSHLCERGTAAFLGFGFDGGFAERVLLPTARRDETFFVLPPTVDTRAGALIEPLSVGLRAVKQAGEVSGARVLVLGAGMIGLAVTQFLRLRGAGWIGVVEPSARRRSAATVLGAHEVIDPLAFSHALRETVGEPVDVVIDCSGSLDGLTDGLRVIRAGGTIVLCAAYGQKLPIALDRIVANELTVRGSFAYLAEFPEVIAAAAAGHIDPAMFISHEMALLDIEQAFLTQLDTSASLKVLVLPNGQ